MEDFLVLQRVFPFMGEKQRVDLDKEVHSRLQVYGMLGETYSQAINRALDEAGAPEAEDVEL